MAVSNFTELYWRYIVVFCWIVSFIYGVSVMLNVQQSRTNRLKFFDVLLKQILVLYYCLNRFKKPKFFRKILTNFANQMHILSSFHIYSSSTKPRWHAFLSTSGKWYYYLVTIPSLPQCLVAYFTPTEQFE